MKQVFFPFSMHYIFSIKYFFKTKEFFINGKFSFFLYRLNKIWKLSNGTIKWNWQANSKIKLEKLRILLLFCYVLEFGEVSFGKIVWTSMFVKFVWENDYLKIDWSITWIYEFGLKKKEFLAA